MKKVLITDAGTPQIIEWAKTQQIENVPNDRNKVLAALVESGWTQDYIMVEDEASPPHQVASDEIEQVEQPVAVGEPIYDMPTKGFGYWRESPMVVCRIMPTDRPGGTEPAHPSINGSPQLVLQRNRLVRIPHDFYLVLKQAGGTKLAPGAKAEDDLVHMDYQEYPLSDVQLPSDKAIAAWQARTAGDELGQAKAKKAA